MRARGHLVAPATLAAIAPACVDDGKGPGAAAQDAAEHGDEQAIAGTDAAEWRDFSGPPPPFATVYAQLLGTKGCASGYCHGGDAAPAGLNLSTTQTAYAGLVGVQAAGADCEGLMRVKPGHPEQSLLWLKLTAQPPPCGTPMPPSSKGLTGPKADLVLHWILGGALP